MSTKVGELAQRVDGGATVAFRRKRGYCPKKVCKEATYLQVHHCFLYA